MDTVTPADWVLHFDGSCTFNPGGRMGVGWHLDTSDGDPVAEGGGILLGQYQPHERSCNTAEFAALLAGLKWVAAVRWTELGTLTVRGDSQLVVSVVSGDWTARKEHLIPLANECEAVVSKLRAAGVKVSLGWIPREQNARADALSAT